MLPYIEAFRIFVTDCLKMTRGFDNIETRFGGDSNEASQDAGFDDKSSRVVWRLF